MNKIPILVALSAAAGTAAAQDTRPVVQVDTAATVAEFPGIASDGDLSAILYQEDSDNSLWVTVSDGRGISWNTPVRIDDKTAGSGNFIATREVIRVAGGNLYACWRDERNSTDDDVYFTWSNDAGNTWAANVMVDKGYPAGGNPVRDYAFDADGDHGAILISVDNGDEELYLVTSTSLSTGALSAAVPVTGFNGLGDTDAIALDLEGSIAHIAFNHDNTGVNQTYYCAYDLVTGSFLSQDVLLSGNVQAAGGDSAGGLDLSADGVNVGVAWEVDGINGTVEELWANALVGGVWLGDALVGQYTLGVHDVDQTTVLMNGVTLCVAWEDDRTGADEAYVATGDVSGGSVVLTADVPVSAGGGSFPAIAGGGDYVAVVCSNGGFPESAAGIASSDGGLTWGPLVTASANSGDVDFAELAYNALYGNFMVSFLSDDAGANDAYVGGFRVASVDAVGTFAAGNPVSFAVSDFGASEEGQFFGLLASGSLGDTLAPDGRNLGLAQDNIYAYTRSRIPGTFSGGITGGAGSTATFNLPNLSPGVTIYFAAIGYDANATLYSLTDVQSVVTQ